MSLSTDIIAAYREHPTIYTAAKKCNCTRDVARRVLLDAGLISSPRANEVRTLLSAGLSAGQIAERLGCTVSAVYNYAPYIRGCTQTTFRPRTRSASANAAQESEIKQK